MAKEADEKKEKETLTAAFNRWKDEEKVERMAKDEERLKEWTSYKDDFLAIHPRRKRCDKPKPVTLKRPETPERFWPIRPKRMKAAVLANDDEGSDDECSDS